MLNNSNSNNNNNNNNITTVLRYIGLLGELEGYQNTSNVNGK